MRVPITGIADIGVLKDLPVAEVPPSGWTDVRNVRFFDGAVRKAEGYSKLLPTPGVAPYSLFPAPFGDQQFWIFLGTTKARGYLAGTTADITPSSGDFTGLVGNLWNGGSFNGLPFVNNGVDLPHVWNPPSLATRLTPMPNFPTTVRAKVMRPFRHFILALHVTKGGTENKRMVKWSHSASSGFPSTWDETDATKDAGEVQLPIGDEELVDCLELGDFNIIYSQGQTWLQRFSGSRDIFAFFRVFGNVGLLSQDCAVVFRRHNSPPMHFVVAQDDIVVHDGVRVQSVASSSIRRFFFNRLDQSKYRWTHVVPLYKSKEVWVLFPTGPSPHCDTALIWNYDTSTWSIRDVPGVARSKTALVNPIYSSPNSWDTDSDSWDSDSSPWSTVAQSMFSETILMAQPSGPNVFFLESGVFLADGQIVQSVLEHDAMAVAGAANDGAPAVDPYRVKMLVEVFPYFQAPAGTVFTFQFAGRMVKESPPSYGPPIQFVVGSQEKVHAYVVGRYISIRITHNGAEEWALPRYDLEIRPMGAF